MAASITLTRRVAYEVLRRSFEQGAFTDRVFRATAERAGLSGRERAQAQRLAFGAVQRRGSADLVIARLARRPAEDLDPAVQAALRLGIFELLYADGTPDHAAINEAVELVRYGGAPKASGLVNAVLRRLVRERPKIESWLDRRADPAQLAAAESLPQWLAERWWLELDGEDAVSLAAAANRPAERALRINDGRWSMAEAVAAAGEAGIKLRPALAPGAAIPGPPTVAGPATPMSGSTTVAHGTPGDAAPALPEDPLALAEMAVVEGSWAGLEPWLEAGLVTPQSRGSAAVVALLDPRPGEHVLDLCAGPGTKSGQIAARLRGHGELIAVEKDEGRAGETSDQLRRLGVHLATVVEADAATVDLRGPGFDRVLVDAPCSDLGALNSRPDARWRKSPQLIERLAQLQATILANAARHLAPGGVLIYSTCTISAAENEDQARRLLQAAGEPAGTGSATGTGAGGAAGAGKAAGAGAAAGGAGLPPLEADDLGAQYPELASGRDSRFLQIRPDRHGTTGFFIARFRRPPADRG